MCVCVCVYLCVYLYVCICVCVFVAYMYVFMIVTRFYILEDSMNMCFVRDQAPNSLISFMFRVYFS